MDTISPARVSEALLIRLLNLNLKPLNVLLDNAKGILKAIAHRHRLGRESRLKERDALQESGFISLEGGESFGRGGVVHNINYNDQERDDYTTYFYYFWL